MVDLAGKTLGKYRLIEQLGRGGFASVYKAYQPRLDRYVAIKVLHPHLIEGEDFLARFEREAKAVARLRHPRIIIVHDFDVEDNIYYMVMEFIAGQSLKERMESLNAAGKRMPLAEVQHIMEDIASALDYAHKRGMLHRDIKPSNVILNEAGDSFLADFGIARILSSGTQFTATGALIGTPAYMSPEQGQGLSVTAATDVYSLGVMLYELLVGRVPFDADTPLAIIFKHIRDSLPSVLAFRPELPEAAERVVYKALAKDPEDRYQSPGELARALREALASEPEAAPPSSEPEVQQEEKPSPPAPPATVVAVKAESEDAKAPTIAVESELEIESADRSKAATIAVDRELEDDSLASDQIPEEEIQPQVMADETVVEGVAKPQKGIPAPKKKKRPILLMVGIPLVALLAVIALGVVLWINFKPEPTKEPFVVQIKPSLTPRPTADPGPEFFDQGLRLLNDEQDYGRAIEMFDEAIRAGFTDAEVYYQRGIACHEWQYYAGECGYLRAIADYNKAIELDPNRADFYTNRAWTYIHLGNFTAAQRDYIKALELEPDNSDYWLWRGENYSRMGNFNAAINDMNRAIRMNPEEPWYYNSRAWAYTNMGDLESAIADWTTAIELNPEIVDFWIERAWREADMENFEAAIEDFSRAIELNRDDPWAYVGRAHAFARSGNNDAAMQDLDRLLEIAPDDADMYVQRGHVFVWMGNPDAAFDAFNRAVEINPDNWEAHLKLGEIYIYDYQNPDQALNELNIAVDLAPPDADWPYLARASYFNNIGEWNKAILDFTRALRISPNNPDAYGQRGYSYQELGNKDSARDDYQKFLNLTKDKPWYDGWRADIEQWLRENP